LKEFTVSNSTTKPGAGQGISHHLGGSYAKLHTRILDSSIWTESKETRLLFITMLAMKDSHGNVSASVPGLANRARLTLPECEESLDRLSAPDPYDSSGEAEGRRIAKIDGGWRVINHFRYRGEDRKAYYHERYESKKRAVKAPVSTPSTVQNVKAPVSTPSTGSTASEQSKAKQINFNCKDVIASPPTHSCARAASSENELMDRMRALVGRKIMDADGSGASYRTEARKDHKRFERYLAECESKKREGVIPDKDWGHYFGDLWYRNRLG
jgi:hypothetical protein